MISRERLPDGAAVGGVGPDAGPVRSMASAGFGSPGEDATVRRISLDDALIPHPQATFAMRAAGGGMLSAGIGDGDVLLVDRVLTPEPGQVVIAIVDGELVCRQLIRCSGRLVLQASDGLVPDNQVGEPTDAEPLQIWGVVTTVIRSLLR
jgi:DNA polymerase V